MDGSIDFQPYLDSICRHYAAWWAKGVLTDSERQQEEPFNFDLQAKEVETKPGRTSKLEEFKPPLPVIQVLNQLVETKKQILLVGQPGAGKTKTLWRYLLELAERAKQNPSAKIPILIRLKDYQTSSDGKHSGLIHLIRKELILLEPEEIERCLFLEPRFILLIDGLNESTSPELRKDLQQFLSSCRRYQVPIVFTTRSLGYRNLEIETQLELQPISPEERQRFLNERVSPSNQQKLRGWLERAHQSNYTPFVLWMLAEVCQQTNSSSQIAETFSLGEAFREFIRLYQDRLYEEGRVSEEDCESWNSQLKQLAFEMLSDEESEDRFIVSRRKAIDVLKSETLLNSLISHHLLIERRDNGKIEFCHQLLQEYYAAGWLLQRLPNLTDEQLKYYFLNYLKWTEAIALMIGLLYDETQVVEIVKKALEVDLMLGAEVSGKAHPFLQKRTIGLMNEIIFSNGSKISEALNIKLLGATFSQHAIPTLTKAINSGDANIRRFSAELLGDIGDPSTIEPLERALYDENSYVCWDAAESLGKIASEDAIKVLAQALNTTKHDLIAAATEGLVVAGSTLAVQHLTQALRTNLNPEARRFMVRGLVRLQSQYTSSALLEVMQEREDAELNQIIGEELHSAINEARLEALFQEPKDVILNLCNSFFGENPKIEELSQKLEDQNAFTRTMAISALAELAETGAFSVRDALIQALQHTDILIRMNAADSLGKIGTPEVLSQLWQLQITDTELFIISSIRAIQEHCGFYNYEINRSDPPPPINSEKLNSEKYSVNNLPTYNFYGSVGNVANIVHGNQINHQDSSLNSKQLATNYSDSTIQAKDVLKVIFNSGEDLGRSPREVRSLPEESLRHWFINSINGNYPGSATGETWNKDGKTDILVRIAERNLLIAECKFWGGEKKLKATLDQLLDRYTTVRDTQIAMLIFSRNKDFTNVKQSIPQAIKQHSSFGREVSIDLEKAWYEYVVFHPDDRACELTLTVLAFHLPN